MSILIDSLVKSEKENQCYSDVKGDWFISKPLNHTLTYYLLSRRVADAFRILRAKSFAVHYKEDEL